MFSIKSAHAKDIELGSTIEGLSQPTATSPKPEIEQGLANFLPLIIIFVVFYLFIIRPQMKKQKAHSKMLDSLKKGDKVIFSSGMIGQIVKIEDDKYVQAEIAQNVKVRFLRSAIIEILNEEKSKEQKDKKPTTESIDEDKKED